MKKYRGYYIDGAKFNNEADIDKFVEQKAVEAYKQACRYFADHMTMEASNYCSEKAEYLVNYFGYTWEAVEALEIEAISTAA